MKTSINGMEFEMVWLMSVDVLRDSKVTGSNDLSEFFKRVSKLIGVFEAFLK